MKKILLIVGLVALVAVAAAGGFYSGMQYQSNKVNQVQANFERERGQFPTGQFPGGQPPAGAAGFEGADGQGTGMAGGFRGAGGISGQVKTIEGNLLTLSTAEDVTEVNLSADTQIQKNTLVTLALEDLQPGMRLMIIGEKDSDGNVAASQIMVLNDMPLDRAYPTPVGTEP
jgi:hypothetical protein